MATKRNTKAVKRAKKVKSLAVRSTKAKGVKGGEFNAYWGTGRSKIVSSSGGDRPME